MSDGNYERIVSELIKAVSKIEERYPDYRNALAQAAVECIVDTADHDDRRLNINKRFDAQIEKIAKQVIAAKEEAQHDSV